MQVVAHHGTSSEVAAKILDVGFIASANDYDWLGDGAYFWENNFQRASTWAIDHHHMPVVLEATINLDDCFDLTDPKWFGILNRNADRILELRQARGLPPLKQENLFHGKDRYVINFVAASMDRAGRPFRSVRGAFAEGSPAFPSSAIFSQSHVQIAVRDPAVVSNLVTIPVERT